MIITELIDLLQDIKSRKGEDLNIKIVYVTNDENYFSEFRDFNIYTTPKKDTVFEVYDTHNPVDNPNYKYFLNDNN